MKKTLKATVIWTTAVVSCLISIPSFAQDDIDPSLKPVGEQSGVPTADLDHQAVEKASKGESDAPGTGADRRVAQWELEVFLDDRSFDKKYASYIKAKRDGHAMPSFSQYLIDRYDNRRIIGVALLTTGIVLFAASPFFGGASVMDGQQARHEVPLKLSIQFHDLIPSSWRSRAPTMSSPPRHPIDVWLFRAHEGTLFASS